MPDMYYLPISELPPNCISCQFYTNMRDGWCSVKPELYVYKCITHRSGNCPITEMPVSLAPILINNQYACPECNENLYRWYAYCPTCGQALLWAAPKDKEDE